MQFVTSAVLDVVAVDERARVGRGLSQGVGVRIGADHQVELVRAI